MFATGKIRCKTTLQRFISFYETCIFLGPDMWCVFKQGQRHIVKARSNVKRPCDTKHLFIAYARYCARWAMLLLRFLLIVNPISLTDAGVCISYKRILIVQLEVICVHKCKTNHFCADIVTCQSVDHLVRASRFSLSRMWPSSVTISEDNLTSSRYNLHLVYASNILHTSFT